MRARNIKPGFFASDLLGECSVEARLLFIGLWLVADREGRLEDRPLRIKGQVFPFDNIDTAPLLDQLVERDFVVRYQVDGVKYLWIPKFRTNQSPHKNEKESIIPPYSGNYPTKSSNAPSDSGNGAKQSALNDERGMMNEESGKRKEEVSADEPAEPPPELLSWIDWWNQLKQEGLVACGVSRDPISEDVKRGWRRVKEIRIVRQLLSDRDVLVREIQASAFLREGWFTLAKLLGGKNRDGAYFVQRIVEGGYRDGAKNGHGTQLSPGKSYDPNATCDLE